MDSVNPFFVLIPIITAFCSLFVIIQLSHPKALRHNRFSSIDGLRGYLALAVFFHHACIWYFFLRTGQWQVPPSNLYTNFGQTGVAFFFMITGFLFYSKLINTKTKSIDWLRLFVSRVLRLTPLYLFAMASMLTIVAILSNFTLYRPSLNILLSVCRWLTFTITGGPDINGVVGTGGIVAGVTWSLPYEWAFYFLLPLLAFLIGHKVNWKLIVGCTLPILLYLFIRLVLGQFNTVNAVFF
jgi:peptidoglycan/LPS O-acetylase OafA/YrhL